MGNISIKELHSYMRAGEEVDDIYNNFKYL